MAYTFINAMGTPSLVHLRKDKLGLAQEIMEKARAKGVNLLRLSTILSVASTKKTLYSCASTPILPDGWMGLTSEKTQELLQRPIGAGTIVWNGPDGRFRVENFASGTRASQPQPPPGAITIIGGGDSAAAAEKLGFADKMTHISTGGGVEFLRQELPGMHAWPTKNKMDKSKRKPSLRATEMNMTPTEARKPHVACGSASCTDTAGSVEVVVCVPFVDIFAVS